MARSIGETGLETLEVACDLTLQTGVIAAAIVLLNMEVMEYLKGSFAYLHRAAAAINEENETETIKLMDNRTRLGLIVDALLHSFNHYGQMVEYLRMNGFVPPASR